MRAQLRPVLPVLVVLIAVLLPLDQVAASFPGPNGRIAYDVDNSSRYFGEVMQVNSFQLGKRPFDERVVYHCVNGSSGGVPIRAGSPPCVGGGDPAYASDGRRLAFVQGGGVGYDLSGPKPRGPLAIANDDGSGFQSLPQLTEEDGQPAWSPRGTSLVFRGKSGSSYDLYIVRTDGSGLRRVTDDPVTDSDPVWRGRRIAFARGGNLFLVRPDGAGLRRLTRRGGAEPAWAPDGSRIAFTRRGDVYVMRADGSRLRRLTRKGGVTPVWSPDGKLLLFHRPGASSGRSGVYVMRSSGRSMRLLLDDSPDVEAYRRIWDFDWGRHP